MEANPERTLDLVMDFIGMQKKSASSTVQGIKTFPNTVLSKYEQQGDNNLLKSSKKTSIEISDISGEGYIHNENIPLLSSSNHKQFISSAVDKYFPSFESTSGWQLHGTYEPIPPVLRKHLNLFFKPYNDLLSQLLGTDQFVFDWSERERAEDNGTYSKDHRTYSKV